MVGQEDVLNECISIMHGKLVLSPEYFNEAISKSLLFCGIRGGVVAMQRV